MTPSTYLQQSIVYFSTAKLRAFLAMLGILVGTAAIVTLLNSGKLATQSALNQFKAMGTDLLAITLFQSQSPPKKAAGNKSIPLSLWRKFPLLIPSIKIIAPYGTVYDAITYEGRNIPAPLIGADQSLYKILHLKMQQGHFITSFEANEHHCIIGAAVAEQFSKLHYGNLMGQHILIGPTVYTIVGVIAPWTENAFFNEDINQAILVPLGSMKLISTQHAIQNAILLLHPNANIEEVSASLRHVIKQQTGSENLFIRSAKQIIAGMEKQSEIFSLLLGTIGGIALLVGGIGIMNVMLVSVQERKQEIGIRKALGATEGHIRRLFLIEATFLSFSGGCLGILFGLLATFIIAQFNHWPYTWYTFPVVIGFVVSVLTGIFFGFYPAYRAAKLDPAVSLRL